jgi:ATP-dependent Lhr-like helicase
MFNLDDLLANAKNLQQEKWDWALPKSLLFKSYASSWLEMDGALAVLKEIAAGCW